MSKEVVLAQDLNQVQEQTPTYLAIGIFDGVHKGHQKLLRSMVEAAHEADRRAAVLTFYPHPITVIEGRSGRLYLCSLEERLQLLAELGLDLIIAETFNDETRHTRAADFIDWLSQNINIDQLWGGAFGLGYRREGDYDFLTKLGAEKGFSVHQYKGIVEWRGQLVSSSRIRESLMAGDLDDAHGCLGRRYQVDGAVIPGDGRGHRLGIPTANLYIWDAQVLPANGVYAAEAVLDSELLAAAVNIGYRPTVNGHSLNVEAHLLDFDREIYGQKLSLKFHARIRDEQKFDSLDSLVKQIHLDIAQVRQLVAGAVNPP